MKKTKREFYNEIMTVEGISEEIKDFCKAEIALLDKKNANRKPSKEQQANEGYKAEILEVLKASGSALTASEIRKASDMLTDAGEVQKVSALLKQLVDSGEVVKTTEGKKSVFSIPVEDEVAETD
jgi:SpoU rRNA methylase family enzyme